MNNPLVSIIVPVYNVEGYLAKGIESCINQSYKNIEILIIDDGSTDNTFEVANKYLNIDKRIKLFKTENYGVSHARNVGLKNCTGEYLVFLDGDDWLYTNTIETLYNLQNNYLTSFIMCGNTISSNGILIDESSFKFSLIKDSNYLIENFGTGLCNSQTACCKLFKTSVIKENKIYFDEQISNIEDGLFVFTYLHYVSDIHYEAIPLWTFLKRENSTTTIKFNKKKLTAIKAIELMKTSFNNNTNTNISLNAYFIRTARWAIIDAIYTDPKGSKNDISFLREAIKKELKSPFCKILTKYDYATILILVYIPINLTILFMTTWKKIMRR